MQIKHYFSNILMTKFIKNMLHGMSSVLNVWPESQHRNYYARLHKSTEDALRKDWERVGQYLWHGIEQVEEYVEKEKEESTEYQEAEK